MEELITEGCNIPQQEATVAKKHRYIPGGRPKGAYSKVSPKVRDRIIREYHEGVPVAIIARRHRISRCWVYKTLQQNGVSGRWADRRVVTSEK